MASAKPKVLIVGGIDVDARLELMQYLVDAFDLSVLGSSDALHEKFRASGFPYAAYILNRRVNPIMDLYTFWQLFFYFRKLRPTIVHTFDTKPCVWGRLAARLAGVPIVIGTLPGLGSLYGDEGLVSRLVRTVYQKLQQIACYYSDLTIFQNKDDASQFIAAGVVAPEKTTVIPGSGVATAVFNPTNVPDAKRRALRVELGLKSDAIVVTMVSRVIRSKGVLEFAAAARAVSEKHPAVQFLLIGPDDRESLDRLTAQELVALREAVSWPGRRNDIPTVLAASDIFVLPSAYREGIPRVLLEAASMGLPIITTNSPGCNEVVEHAQNGLLVPVRDVNALIQSLIQLIEIPDQRRRFGNVSREKAIERFDIKVIANMTRQNYLHFLEKNQL